MGFPYSPGVTYPVAPGAMPPWYLQVGQRVATARVAGWVRAAAKYRRWSDAAARRGCHSAAAYWDKARRGQAQEAAACALLYWAPQASIGGPRLVSYGGAE